MVELVALADAKGWDHLVITDEGYSGKNPNRPGIIRALGMLAGNEADVLLVVRPERLSRDLHDGSGLLMDSA